MIPLFAVDVRYVPFLLYEAFIAGATLLYRVNFAPEQQLIMRTDGKPGRNFAIRALIYVNTVNVLACISIA
jgi:hypothetical protein